MIYHTYKNYSSSPQNNHHSLLLVIERQKNEERLKICPSLQSRVRHANEGFFFFFFINLKICE